MLYYFHFYRHIYIYIYIYRIFCNSIHNSSIGLDGVGGGDRSYRSDFLVRPPNFRLYIIKCVLSNVYSQMYIVKCIVGIYFIRS